MVEEKKKKQAWAELGQAQISYTLDLKAWLRVAATCCHFLPLSATFRHLLPLSTICCHLLLLLNATC